MVISVKPSMIKKYCQGLKAYSGIVTLIIASICVVTTKVLDATLASHPRVDIQPDAYDKTVTASASRYDAARLWFSYFVGIAAEQTLKSSDTALFLQSVPSRIDSKGSFTSSRRRH